MSKKTILETLVCELKATRGSWPVISEESGVPKTTLFNIASGTSVPSVTLAEQLLNYFAARKAALHAAPEKAAR